MKTKAAELRHLYRRLRAAGCRLDYDHLPSLPMPLRVCTPTWHWQTHVFPMSLGSVVVVPIRIVALKACTIRKWTLWGSWFPQGGQILQQCSEFQHEACFQDGIGTHHHLGLEQILNHRLRGSVFRRGFYRQGYLALMFPVPVLSRARTELEITLEITDEFDDDYPYDLWLTHDPAAAAETTAALLTTYRPPPKQ